MPSGSRRRKAAKKKKGNDPNINKSSPTLHSTENDDLRNQEERDSDGGDNEVVSPVSVGNSQDQFPEGGNELEKAEDLPPVQSVASESISSEGDTVDSKQVQIPGLDSEGNGILEENVKEMNPEDVPESTSVDVVCDESVEILTNGYHDEKIGIDLSDEPRFDVESELVKPESSILEAPESGDSAVDSVFTAFEKFIHDVAEVAPSETSLDSGLDLRENEEKELKPRDYSSEIAQNVFDVSSEVEEDVESVAVVSEEVVHVNEPIPDDTILDSASDLKENEEKELQTGVYSSLVPQTLLNISSNVEESTLSDSAPIVETCLDKAESIPLVAEKVIHLPETAPVETVVSSGSDLKGNGEEVVVPVETVGNSVSDLKGNREEVVVPVETVVNSGSDLKGNGEEVVVPVETVVNSGSDLKGNGEEVVVPVKTVVNSGSDLKENGEEIVLPVESSIGSDKAAISEEVIYVNGTAPTENVSKELLAGDCTAQTPGILLDFSSKVQESTSKLSSLAATAIEKEDRSLPISDCSTVRASSSVESSKEPESYETSENQPLIATAPRQVEKTSWFGCCGIFDLISGTR